MDVQWIVSFVRGPLCQVMKHIGQDGGKVRHRPLQQSDRAWALLDTELKFCSSEWKFKEMCTVA